MNIVRMEAPVYAGSAGADGADTGAHVGPMAATWLRLHICLETVRAWIAGRKSIFGNSKDQLYVDGADEIAKKEERVQEAGLNESGMGPHSGVEPSPAGLARVEAGEKLDKNKEMVGERKKIERDLLVCQRVCRRDEKAPCPIQI